MLKAKAIKYEQVTSAFECLNGGCGRHLREDCEFDTEPSNPVAINDIENDIECESRCHKMGVGAECNFWTFDQTKQICNLYEHNYTIKQYEVLSGPKAPSLATCNGNMDDII